MMETGRIDRTPQMKSVVDMGKSNIAGKLRTRDAQMRALGDSQAVSRVILSNNAPERLTESVHTSFGTEITDAHRRVGRQSWNTC